MLWREDAFPDIFVLDLSLTRCYKDAGRPAVGPVCKAIAQFSCFSSRCEKWDGKSMVAVEIDAEARAAARPSTIDRSSQNVNTILGLSIGPVMDFGYPEPVIEHVKTGSPRSGFALLEKSAALFTLALGQRAAAFVDTLRYRKYGLKQNRCLVRSVGNSGRFA